MQKLLVSCGIFLSLVVCSLVWAHDNGDGHDVTDPTGISYQNISGDTSLRRSTCLVYGTDETYFQQAIGYHNDLVSDNGDGIMDRRCYWSLVFMSASPMRMTSPLVFQGGPARVVSGERLGVLIDLNTDTTTPTGYVTFVLDARGLGDCPIRFSAGVNAHIEHLTIMVDNPQKALCRSDGATSLYSSLNNGHTTETSQSVTDREYAVIDDSVTIQPALTFPEASGSGGESIPSTGGFLGSGGLSATGGVSGSGGMGSGGQSGASGSGGVSNTGTGGNSQGSGGIAGGSGGSRAAVSDQQATSPATYGVITKVDSGGCNRIP